MGERTRRGYKLDYEGEKVDDLLQQVDEKTIYDDASQDEHGLMGTEDKVKLDEIQTMTNQEIEALFR